MASPIVPAALYAATTTENVGPSIAPSLGGAPVVPDTGLRAVDLRFLLPELPASVRLVGEPAGCRAGLAAAGIPVVDRDAPLTVAAAGLADDAVGSPSVIV